MGLLYLNKVKPMKFILLLICLVAAAVSGANPADYDPYHDNDHDTYHLIAAAIPFAMPQEEETGTWHSPPPGPNAEACRLVWDKGVPCAVDGKFYGNWGELQPEYCDNDHFNKDGKTLKPEAEKCKCNVAMTTDQKNCPVNNKGEPIKNMVDGATCMVYCREKTHCHCVDICDMAFDDKAAQPAKKGGK